MSHDPGGFIRAEGNVGIAPPPGGVRDGSSTAPLPRLRAISAEAAPRWVALTAVASFIWMVATSLLLGWGLHRMRGLSLATEGAHSVTERVSSPASSARSNGTPASDAEERAREVPVATRASTLGAIEVVELGLSSGEFPSSLREQLRLARSASRTMLVLVTEERDCATCRGVDDAFEDARLQEALATVRLVRVARSAFKEELAALRLQTDVYPMFLLLRDDLSLLDAIHGGEWDADIPANIAPVLGAFVRGQYRERRHPTWTPAVRGLRL